MLEDINQHHYLHEYGNVSVISEPNEGDTEGDIVIEYTVNTVENVDRMTTIAGFDDIEISISGTDDLDKFINLSD